MTAFPSPEEGSIKGLSPTEILGEIERATDEGKIYLVKRIKEELIDFLKDKRGYAGLPEVKCLRYAERSLGVLIRRGQVGPDRWISGTWIGKPAVWPEGVKTPMDFFGSFQERAAAFAMADDVTDEQFSDAIARCEAAGSFSRPRVIEALEKTNPPKWVGRQSDRPEVLQKRRRVDVDRVIEQSIGQLNSVFEGIGSVLSHEDFASISNTDARRWDAELSDITGYIRNLRKRLKRGQGDG